MANEPAPAVSVEGAKVEVGAGATLDLTGTTGRIAAMTIDCATGAGRVVALNCAETGAVYLKNAASLSSGSPIMEVPGAGNVDLSAWKVYFDGVERKNCKARVKNGAVVVVVGGMQIIVR